MRQLSLSLLFLRRRRRRRRVFVAPFWAVDVSGAISPTRRCCATRTRARARLYSHVLAGIPAAACVPSRREYRFHRANKARFIRGTRMALLQQRKRKKGRKRKWTRILRPRFLRFCFAPSFSDVVGMSRENRAGCKGLNLRCPLSLASRVFSF